MTTRLYLGAVEFINGPVEDGDIPVERVFVSASDVPEVWVETELVTLPSRGKAAMFALARTMDLGFTRIRGTVVQTLDK